MNQAALTKLMDVKRERVIDVRDRIKDLLKAYADACNDIYIEMWQKNISLTPLMERLTYYKTAVDPFFQDLFRDLIMTTADHEIDIRQSVCEDFYTFRVSTTDIVDYVKLEYYPSKPMGVSDVIIIEWNIVNKDCDDEILYHDPIPAGENGKRSLLYVITGLFNGIDPRALGFKSPAVRVNSQTTEQRSPGGKLNGWAM